MRTRLFALPVLALVASLFALVAPPGIQPAGASEFGGDGFFTGELDGAEEVPANASTASGFGRVRLNALETQITVSVHFSGLSSNTTAGHIHGAASPGVNAPVVFNLSPPVGVTSGSVVNVQHVITPTQVADLKAGRMYFNIHTSNFPGGEIRGQITPDNVFAAHLTGSQEVPPSGSTATGSGYVSLNDAATQALVSVDFSGLSAAAVAGHIHFAQSGQNGPIVCDLSPPGVTAGSIVDALCDVTSSGAGAVKLRRTYINIHTGNFPGGEIRGQVLRQQVICDFDGDGRADPTVVRNTGSQLQWWVRGSAGGGTQVLTWGSSAMYNTSRLMCGDFDGDGRSDPVIWHDDGTTPVFWVLLSGGGFIAQPFGQAGDNPQVIGDYDGDGRFDLAVYRPSTGTYWYRLTATGQTHTQNWGTSTDIPDSVPDLDGDGRTDFVVQRGSQYWARLATGQTLVRTFGVQTDLASQTDYDGDGRGDLAVTRATVSGRVWYVLSSLTGVCMSPCGGTLWGPTTGPRAAADYDGDGDTDIAGIQPSGGAHQWWVRGDNGFPTQVFNWGATTDYVLASWIWR